MDNERIHRAVSDDGTEIAGRVHGQGPPMVLVHGGLEDGDLCWSSLVPLLSDRFTCYPMSTRGRGLSAEHPRVSPDRLVRDVTAFAESIGEPVYLVGESSGGMLALGTAARSDAVSAVAAYEPVVFEVFGEEGAAAFEETVARVSELAAEGRLADAARAFAEPLVNDDELDAVSRTDYFEAASSNVPALLQEIRQFGESDEAHGPTHPSVLERITVPTLLMHGSRTARTWFPDGVRHVADHVADPHVREVAGAGHWGPVLEPEPVAAELVRFFEEALQTA